MKGSHYVTSLGILNSSVIKLWERIEVQLDTDEISVYEGERNK